jgi:hypothetical protein
MNKDHLIINLCAARRQFDRYLFVFERSPEGGFIPGEQRKLTDDQMTRPGILGTWMDAHYQKP